MCAKISDPEVRPLFTLTEDQRKFLEELQKIDAEWKFESKYFSNIREILKNGIYSNKDADILNNIRTGYIEYKRTGKVPSEFEPDLPF